MLGGEGRGAITKEGPTLLRMLLEVVTVIGVVTILGIPS